jgi:hypothetical protein
MRRSTKFILLIAIVIAGVLFAGWQLTRPKAANLSQELQSIVNGTVGNGKTTRNVVLQVARGDGSFTFGHSQVRRERDQIRLPRSTS